MNMIRISTSPPSNYNFKSDECSYYCDIYLNGSGEDLEIVSANKNVAIFPGLDKKRRIMIVTQYMFSEDYKEVGALIEFINDDGELMYYGIDYQGNGRAEASVNEAAWHIANAGEHLPDEYMLKRTSEVR